MTTRGGPFRGASSGALGARARKMLAHLGLRGAELSLALVDDRAIRELNRTWRRRDEPTDVLAFPAAEPPSESGLLGDVVLSIDTARRQARARARPLLAETTMLLAHGLLHLLGHDHRTRAEERAMTARTRDLEAAAARRARRRPSPR